MLSQGPPLSPSAREDGRLRRDPRTQEREGQTGPDQWVNSVNFHATVVNRPSRGITMGLAK
ncbi:hypothetical protein GCM10010501_40300 [Streptomyces libani subsp. rufus]|nr:hypothetical protein GCM10010501_40300 [Streptomyces libani subsp. rufus]